MVVGEKGGEDCFGNPCLLPQVDLLCRALSFLLVTPGVLPRVGDVDALLHVLGDGLGSALEPVRLSAARFFLAVALRRVDADGDALVELLYAPAVLGPLCQRLGDESTVVGEAAAATLVALAGGATQVVAEGWIGQRPAPRRPPPPPPQADRAKALVAALVDAADAAVDDSVVTARIVAVTCAVAGASSALFALADAAGLPQRVAAVLTGDDALLILSLLGSLPGLASTAAGLTFTSQRVLPRLRQLAGFASSAGGGAVEDGEEDGDALLSSLVGPAAAGAVAEVAYVAATSQGLAASQPLLDDLLPGLIRVTTDACRSTGDPDRLAGFVAALSRVLSASSPALDAALGDDDLMREWLENGVAADAGIRAAVLAGVAAILQEAAPALERAAAAAAVDSSASGGSAPAADKSYERYERLFDSLGRYCGRDATEVALGSLRRPEPEPRQAAYALLAAAASLRGGGERWLRRVLGADGVAPYLLDRGTEAAAGSGMGGWEAKWAVLAAAAANPALVALGETFAGAVRRYVEQGPVAPPARGGGAQVATHAARS